MRPDIAKLLNKPQSRASRLLVEALDPKFFSDGKSLDPAARSALLAVARDVIDDARSNGTNPDVQGIILTGSQVSADYDAASDLDLHIVVTLPEDEAGKVLKLYLDTLAKNYNSKGYKLRGQAVEVYFQDSTSNLVAPGVYDLVAGDWSQKPGEDRHEIGEAPKLMAAEYLKQAKALEQELPKDLGADLARGYLARADILREAIRALRKQGLANGLYGDGNLAFKLMRRNGTFEILNKIVAKTRKAILGVDQE